MGNESETSALNERAPEEQVLLNTTEGAAISRRDVALHIEKMEQRFAMDLKELRNRLNVEQTDHSNNSDTSNNSSNQVNVVLPDFMNIIDRYFFASNESYLVKWELVVL